MTRKKLPIGIQTLREIREEGYYYVDKTDFALRLIETGKYYFLSRPRRFGKSLFLDTLAELFAGNERLFQGLSIHKEWNWERRHPVVRFSFAGGVLHSRQALDEKIAELLDENERLLGVRGKHRSVSGRFTQLIRLAQERHGAPVVVLVDEYDKPILDNLTRPDLAAEMREGLRDLYSVIKSADAHLRFAFLTGVSKFSKVSIFSGLNTLHDITVSRTYSAICGYTETDLEQVFAPALEGLDREQIRRWYNGYNWTGESVYNPFDLLLLLDERCFRPWWFETGTPTFLIDLLTQRGFFTPRLARLRADDALLSAFDVEHMAPEALLWQTGYLSFKGTRQIGARTEYTLGYPNLEVETALNDVLAKALVGNPGRASELASRLYDLLAENDLQGLRQHIESLFAAIPHQWHDTNPVARYEGYYASVIYSHFAALGLDLTPEDSSSAGRLDLALRFQQRLYLFEFKVVELEPEGGALQQIKDRGYAEKYRAEGIPIHLIGIEFSRQRRTVVGFEVENEGSN
ncbi:ATP-binding protein [Thiorhodococcus mannitoliphagus]|uniref:ATP-binding protein n=1 Tax=Thiorhodococcus mannitoliphagus TaxID=329406 RepID=A0A6P1DXY6_9GAMM|nr:ATP-binding protein [Thiorhodococcus mannitoliphagus]NEX22340.1 ATP-binding protein [Thiorhodococcus mannitoliphagus]